MAQSQRLTKWQRIKKQMLALLQQGVKTTHHRIVMVGLLVGLCYLPVWIFSMLSSALHGSTDLILVPAIAYLGFQGLWKHRHQLAQVSAFPEERLLGYLLILGGAIAFPFCRFDTWPQAIVWAMILIGIAYSFWGPRLFSRYPLPTTLILLSTYPNLGFASRVLWRALTPPDLLENFMAWSGELAMRAIGQAAVANGPFISLPAGSVKVAFGCNGYDMAFTLAIGGLILGLFFKESGLKIFSLVAIGIVLALIFNIPRIVLVTFAAVYWGKASFDFWHGPIGGQILAGILMTLYYYIAMALLNQPASKEVRSEE